MPLNKPLWLDAHLKPSLAPWIADRFGLVAYSFERLGHLRTADEKIFALAREADAVVVTKDADFLRLLAANGPPPSVLWLTMGNTSAANLRAVFEARLDDAIALLASGEALVEIAER
ncbi:MAG: DUF5615 family PIN-like protein [Oceanicaulis sp.]